MESIQQQIGSLTRKVERVYQIVDRLNQHVFQDLDPQLSGTETSIDDSRSIDLRRLSSGSTTGDADLPGGANYGYDTAEGVIAQPEILIDASGVEISHHQLKQDLSPQIQIQRLTAQLTAAYNRIAALEEQLLANRWK